MDDQMPFPKPKSLNRAKGAEGEKLAVEHLLSKGYSIEQLNWKGYRCEIDIIAKQGDTIIFVEVKTRSGTYFG